MKPYDNKKKYDSGRLRHKVQFLVDVVTDDGYGGSFVANTLVLQTWAGKEEVSQYTLNGLNAGQTQYNYYQYFVIRKRTAFVPKKDIVMVFDGHSYIIQTVIELDDPCTFLKLLCVASETSVNLNGLVYAGGSLTVPVTANEIKQLPYVFTAQSSDLTFGTGLNKIFTIAIPDNRSINKIYDNTSDEDITELYIKGDSIIIDGLSYNIYTMQNALEFTTNHIHRVILS